MAGLRDVLIHHYFGVSISRIWKMIKNELAKVKNDISVLINEWDNEDENIDFSSGAE